ncbi:Aste57867_22028 [Aphanomyces stellatus]|uniref:Aste57867_22028 protein n=1 Tax=Aphanomyces stellatus TaxID=120398 RepID=A0A485LJ59_9STRA|nr:hypothetical protein As57867_021959 [Aphanomyces stellatus]VFT98696.1 Aste57867_22028 [Aphanomyces stellatus]
MQVSQDTTPLTTVDASNNRATTTLSAWAGKTISHFRSTAKSSSTPIDLDPAESPATPLFQRIIPRKTDPKSDVKGAVSDVVFAKSVDDKDIAAISAAVKGTPKLVELPLHDGGLLLHALCRWPSIVDVLNLVELAVHSFPEGVATMDAMGRTPLHWLCMNTSVTVRSIEILVLGFPVSAAMCDKDSSLPIHYLCMNPAQTIDLTMMLHNYETFSLRNRDGRTPLHCLLIRHTADFELCATLLSLAPEAIHVIDNMGRRILHWVCAMKKHFNLQLLQLVLSMDQTAAGHSDMRGQLPLHLLLRNHVVTVDAIQLLLQAHPAAIDVIDASGQSPLHLLCTNNAVTLAMLHVVCARAVAFPTCFKWLDDEGSSALHLLGTNPHATTAMVRLILQTYPDAAHLVDMYGCTPFHYFCSSAAVTADLLWIFLDKCPAITKLVDQRGKTPLHYICANAAVSAEMISIVFDSYPTSSQAMDHAMKLPVHYVIENPAIPSDMAYRLLANGSAYRLRYDIREDHSQPHASIAYTTANGTPATVFCAVDIALDSRTSKQVELCYFSDDTTFQHMLTIHAQLSASTNPVGSTTDVATLMVALVDSFDNARKRIRVADASPILDNCLVVEHPTATLADILAKGKVDVHALITQLGQGLSHYHCNAGVTHGNITPRTVGHFGSSAFKLVPSLVSMSKDDATSLHYPLTEPTFCSPEMAKALLDNSPLAVPTLASDMWQFGCTIFEAMTSTPLVHAIAPYSVCLPHTQLYHVIASFTDTVIGHALAPLPSQVREILVQVLKVQPTARWTIDRVMGVAGFSMASHHPNLTTDLPAMATWSSPPPLDNQEPEVRNAALLNEIDHLVLLLQQTKTQLRRVELDRDALQRQLSEFVDHFNVVLQEKEESKQKMGVAEKKRASLASQLDTMVQMVISVMPLAQQVYGPSGDDFLAHTMAQSANATVRPAYALSTNGHKGTVAEMLKTHIRKTMLSKGCVAKWASQQQSPPLLSTALMDDSVEAKCSE